MKRELLINFAAASALSLGLMLADASPGFAGISNFSINSPATFISGSNNKQVIVTGTVTCPSGKEITIGVQMVQQGKMAAHASGEFRGECGTSALINWQLTASSPVPMQEGPASALVGVWACTPSGLRPTGPCEFAHSSGEITLQ